MSTDAGRDRPQGQTSGSDERPGRWLKGTVLSFDFAGEADALRRERAWEKGDRNARTLVEEADYRVVLTIMKQGATLHEHRTPGFVSVQTLDGHLQLRALQQTIDMPAGQFVTLEPDVAHAVQALEESTFLISVAALARGGQA